MAVALTVFTACEDAPPPPQRGFSSRQLYAVRDPTLTFWGWRNGVWTFSTGPGDAAEYWSVDIDTGTVLDLGAQLPPYVFPPPPPHRYDCQPSRDGPPFDALITDTQTGITTTIRGVVGGWTCPGDADPTFPVWLQDQNGELTYWSGPYDHLTQVPIELVVQQVVSFNRAFDGRLIEWRVFGFLPGKPDQTGLFLIDGTTFVVTPILPPRLASAAWADGSAPEGTLDSSTLSEQFFMSAGPGFYVYSRGMSDGGATLFAGPFGDGPAELALLRLAPSSQLDDLSTFPEPTLRYRPPAGGGSDVLLAFDGRAKRLTLCPSPFDQQPVLAQHPGGAFTAAWSPGGAGRPLLLIGPGTCDALVADDVIAAGFSPDQTTLAWLTRPIGSKGTFWTAAIDGSAARELGGGGGTITDSPNAPRFFGAGGQLQFQLDEDLVWLDVHDDPARLHYVAEHLHGRVIDLDKWLVAVYERSTQSGTGRLALIERATGTKRLISPDVATFDTVGSDTQDSPPLAPTAVDAPFEDVHQFIYVVRGRNPSSQDGIWIATIAASDLQ